MRAGVVATIRVNPRDCQSVLDLCIAIGMPVGSMSFASMVSMALASGLETLRTSGALPEPDEFQFANRMAPYMGAGKPGRKARIAKTLHDRGGEMRAPTMPREHDLIPRQGTSAEPVESASGVSRQAHPAGFTTQAAFAPKAQPSMTEEQRHASQRLTELLAKQDAVSDNIPGLVWTEADAKEYEQCSEILYGKR